MKNLQNQFVDWRPPAAADETTTRTFSTGATRDTDTDKVSYRCLSPLVLARYARYMHECRTRNVPDGQTTRAPDNWAQGMPRQAYMDSLLRHVVELWTLYNAGIVSEDACSAVMFNVMGLLHEQLLGRDV